jgi:NAD(P)-dependent dehydrogenase (short-subunit alcohol dehydrogenase family)
VKLGNSASHPVLELFDLSGRTAIVTGGAGLYGQPVCAALAELGAHVVVASRDMRACRDAADALTERGLAASSHPLDLADEASIGALCHTVVRQHGAIDILVNNAVHRRGGTIDATTADDWRSTSTVNSLGLFLACKHASERMIASGRGVIVNVASIYGIVGADFNVYEHTDITSPASYAYDKGGMINLTRHLASWLGPHGIRVNCVSPGGLRTPDQPAPFVAAYTRRVPLGRLAGPEDIKAAVAFLASDASAYVTGINLPVDGGWTAI